MTARVKFDTHTGTEVLRVEIFNELDGQRSDAEFHKFPVRIGRNRKNDLVLLHEYVSSWHATIGFVGGRLGIPACLPLRERADQPAGDLLLPRPEE